MSGPPKAVQTRTFVLDRFAVQEIMRHIAPTAAGQPAPVAEASAYLRETPFPLDRSGATSQCPAKAFPAGPLPPRTSAGQARALLFAGAQSITARSIEQLREALAPHAGERRSVSTGTHVCLEVTTTAADPSAVTVKAWNPLRQDKP